MRSSAAAPSLSWSTADTASAAARTFALSEASRPTEASNQATKQPRLDEASINQSGRPTEVNATSHKGKRREENRTRVPSACRQRSSLVHCVPTNFYTRALTHALTHLALHMATPLPASARNSRSLSPSPSATTSDSGKPPPPPPPPPPPSPLEEERRRGWQGKQLAEFGEALSLVRLLVKELHEKGGLPRIATYEEEEEA